MALSREEIAARYGAALFGFAQDQNTLDDIYQEMMSLKKAIAQNPQLLALLSDPITRSSEKRAVLEAVSEPFSTEVKEFLSLLLEYNRFTEIEPIIERFGNLYDHFKGIGRGNAITAVKLDQAQLEKLEQAYANKYHLNALRLENEVDKSILGGVILQVEDRVIDGSVRNRLNKIRVQLTSND